MEIAATQADDEAILVDAVAQDAPRCDGIICNPASLTPCGLTLCEALRESGLPVAIVHLTNVAVRRDWGQRDIFMDVARIYIAGAGWVGYGLAVVALDALLRGRIPP
jgi:3-dehydroquinate dehydratase-2